LHEKLQLNALTTVEGYKPGSKNNVLFPLPNHPHILFFNGQLVLSPVEKFCPVVKLTTHFSSVNDNNT
jgi:hypothetical protein